MLQFDNQLNQDPEADTDMAENTELRMMSGDQSQSIIKILINEFCTCIFKISTSSTFLSTLEIRAAAIHMKSFYTFRCFYMIFKKMCKNV